MDENTITKLKLEVARLKRECYELKKENTRLKNKEITGEYYEIDRTKYIYCNSLLQLYPKEFIHSCNSNGIILGNLYDSFVTFCNQDCIARMEKFFTIRIFCNYFKGLLCFLEMITRNSLGKRLYYCIDLNKRIFERISDRNIVRRDVDFDFFFDIIFPQVLNKRVDILVQQMDIILGDIRIGDGEIKQRHRIKLTRLSTIFLDRNHYIFKQIPNFDYTKIRNEVRENLSKMFIKRFIKN